MTLLAASSGTVAATPNLNDFKDLCDFQYGTIGTVLDGCFLCHVSTNGGNRNDYGNAFAAMKISNDTTDVQDALTTIEPGDSDGDII
jgi:hypothetical protein